MHHATPLTRHPDARPKVPALADIADGSGATGADGEPGADDGADGSEAETTEESAERAERLQAQLLTLQDQSSASALQAATLQQQLLLSLNGESGHRGTRPPGADAAAQAEEGEILAVHAAAYARRLSHIQRARNCCAAHDPGA